MNFLQFWNTTSVGRILLLNHVFVSVVGWDGQLQQNKMLFLDFLVYK